MKKIFSLLVVGLLVLVYACGGGGGDDPKSVMKAYFDAFDDMISGLEKADSADDVAAALNKMADTAEKLKPKMKALEEKYPELKNMKEGKMPEEFKEFEARLKELGPRMMGAFGKIAQYGSDPKVVEAQKKFDEMMK